MAVPVSELGQRKDNILDGNPQKDGDESPLWLTPDRLRRAEVILRKMNLYDPAETQMYVDALNDTSNRAHFSDPPATIEALQAYAAKEGHHVLVSVAKVKDPQNRYQYVPVGGAGIEDAAPNQEDHFMVRVVIAKKFQGRYGLGKKTVRSTINYAARHRASDGRVRNKLDVAIIRGVAGSDYMEDTVRKMFPNRVGILKEQVNVPIPLKEGVAAIVKRDVARYSYNLETWRQITGIEAEPPRNVPSK